MSKKVIARSSGFISVLEPYNADAFVRSEYIYVKKASEKRHLYLDFINKKSKLPEIVRGVIESNNEEGRKGDLRIIDCGVFMGTFSVAAGLIAAAEGIVARQSAYEANSALIDPIRENFSGYGLDIDVHNNGVSGARGTLEFAHSAAGIIGGSLVGAAGRGGEYTKQICEVLPLSDILDDGEALSVVKLDIEGSETSAFNSIRADRNKLSNVFIVEYAPWQGVVKLDDGQTYNEFLVENFEILDLRNWMFSQVAPVEDAAALERVLETGHKRPNTDLVLIPRGAGEIAARLTAEGVA